MLLIRPPKDLNFELLVEKCSDFASFQIWPLRARMDPRGWLSNFSDDDQPLARHLLNAFTYFSEDITRQLSITALRGISALPDWRANNSGDIFAGWSEFVRRFRLTHVTGETPNPTDSGHLFTRIARDFAGIAEGQIAGPQETLRRILLHGDNTPVVFVDDFGGSGNQFYETWVRRYNIDGTCISFADVAANARHHGRVFEAYYSVAICTAYGVENIERDCPGVRVSAGNILDERYSIFHADSLVWPLSLLNEGQAWVHRVSTDLGFVDDDGEWGTKGFHGLGLALGFSHKTPDATIPIFRYDRNGWKPLVRDV